MHMETNTTKWRTNVSWHGLEKIFYRRLYSPILLSICKNMQKYSYIIPTQLKLLMCAKLTLESCLLAPKAVQNTTTVQGMRCFLPIYKNASIQISSPRQLKHVNSLKPLIVQPYKNHKRHVSKSFLVHNQLWHPFRRHALCGHNKTDVIYCYLHRSQQGRKTYAFVLELVF